jgi:multicomponent Na+:H+ antiporter subunit D
MSMGAVLLRTGTIKGSELGGLYKSMPWTAGFCIVGAASISAFPLFSGFITKSMVMAAAAGEGYTVVWLILLFASAGVFHHAGIKIPYFAFFSHDSGRRCKEAPANMLAAMALAAILCIGIGSWPAGLYSLLLFSALAFSVLMRTGIYPPELRSTNLDFDWWYRRLVPAAWTASERWVSRTLVPARHAAREGATQLTRGLYRHYGPDGVLARTSPTGSMALWVMVMLLGYLLLYYA